MAFCCIVEGKGL